MIFVLKSILFILFTTSAFFAHAVYNGTDIPIEQIKRTHRIKLEQNQMILSPCSATFISDYTILTAAHCVDKLNLESDIFFHSNENRFEVESIFIPLEYFKSQNRYRAAIGSTSEIHYHRTLALNDIAIINLKRAVLGDYMQVELVFEKTFENAPVTVAGTGYTKFNHEENYFYNNPLKAHGRELELSVFGSGVYFVKGESLNDYITTPGDSGGPMFLGNSNKQIAVLRGSSATLSRSASIYTPIYLHQHFIEKYSK